MHPLAAAKHTDKHTGDEKTADRRLPVDRLRFKSWGGRWVLNPRPPEPQSGALTPELHPPRGARFYHKGSGDAAAERDRNTETTTSARTSE